MFKLQQVFIICHREVGGFSYKKKIYNVHVTMYIINKHGNSVASQHSSFS